SRRVCSNRLPINGSDSFFLKQQLEVAKSCLLDAVFCSKLRPLVWPFRLRHCLDAWFPLRPVLQRPLRASISIRASRFRRSILTSSDHFLSTSAVPFTKAFTSQDRSSRIRMASEKTSSTK